MPTCKQPIVTNLTTDERDPANWPAAALQKLQRILNHSRTTAGHAVQDTFQHPERLMDAEEFVRFWNTTRMKAMATVGASGAPHIAPVHAEFVNGTLRSTIFETALRRRDLQTNPRVSLTTWGANGAAAIVYGKAREIPESLRESRTGATGGPRRTVSLEIKVTRVYAMRGRNA